MLHSLRLRTVSSPGFYINTSKPITGPGTQTDRGRKMTRAQTLKYLSTYIYAVAACTYPYVYRSFYCAYIGIISYLCTYAILIIFAHAYIINIYKYIFVRRVFVLAFALCHFTCYTYYTYDLVSPKPKSPCVFVNEYISAYTYCRDLQLYKTQKLPG